MNELIADTLRHIYEGSGRASVDALQLMGVGTIFGTLVGLIVWLVKKFSGLIEMTNEKYIKHSEDTNKVISDFTNMQREHREETKELIKELSRISRRTDSIMTMIMLKSNKNFMDNQEDQ